VHEGVISGAEEFVQEAPCHGVLAIATFGLCAAEAREVDYVV
jgi:hypothetical protein